MLAIPADARVTVLTAGVSASDPIRYANSVVVAPDETIYFTDSSTRFSPEEWGGTYPASVLDIMEQSATGRVLAYEPATGATRVVAHGLSFANGIALSTDGHTLFVNETGRFRIWKIDGRASQLDVRSGSPQASVLLDNLPGYPDNLMRGREGRIWVGLFRPRNPSADSLSDRPFMRKLLLRLPRSVLPLGEPYGHIFAIDEDGHVTADLQDPSGAYPETTSATETAERLYIQSLHAHAIGWLPTDSFAAAPTPTAALEEIYILRSIREPHEPVASWCSSGRTGFEPFPRMPIASSRSGAFSRDPRTGESSRRRRSASPTCVPALAPPATARDSTSMPKAIWAPSLSRDGASASRSASTSRKPASSRFAVSWC